MTSQTSASSVQCHCPFNCRTVPVSPRHHGRDHNLPTIHHPYLHKQLPAIPTSTDISLTESRAPSHSSTPLPCVMSRTVAEKVEIVWRWFQDNIFDRPACAPYLPLPHPPILSPLPSTAPPRSLRVLSFNTWGLPIAPRCSQRLSHLSTLFPSYDVLCLQEMSHNRDVHRVIQLAVSHGLPFSHQFRQGVGFPVWNGITAPGLLVLSRFPICEVAVHRFPVNGLLQRFDHSDWVAAKGVGLIRVDVSSLHPQRSEASPPVLVDVFLTHLHANYSNFYFHYARCYSALSPLPIPSPFNCPDLYLPHRVCQAYTLARFFSTHRHPQHLAVLCGDLNAPPYDIVIHLIQALTGLEDAYAVKGGGGPGYTCGAFDNLFSQYSEAVARGEDEVAVRRRHTEVDRHEEEHKTWNDRGKLWETPKRIDYCLFSLPTTASSGPSTPLSKSPQPTLTDCQVVKPTMDIEGKRYSLSDHHGVSATFTFSPSSSTSSPLSSNGSTPHSQLRVSDRLTPAVRLSLDLSPPISPIASRQSSSPALPTASLPVTPSSAASSPSLSTLLSVAIAIVTSGIEETRARRRHHWLFSARAALIFLFLTCTSTLQYDGGFANALHSTLEKLVMPAFGHWGAHHVDVGVGWFVWTVLWLGGWMRALAGLSAVLVFLVAQFPSKEEEMALMETLQEMRIDCQRARKEEALTTSASSSP